MGLGCGLQDIFLFHFVNHQMGLMNQDFRYCLLQTRAYSNALDSVAQFVGAWSYRQTKSLQVQFPVRAHALVTCYVPVRVHVGGNQETFLSHYCFCPFLSLLYPLSRVGGHVLWWE